MVMVSSVLAQPYLIAQQATLAVINLEGIGVSENDAKALSERLRNELFRLGKFKVIERGLMENILSEQDFQQTGCTSNECLVEIGEILGVEQMIGGTISRVGKLFSVSARLLDVETGELLSVSDYDLRGGIEEILIGGMQKVAVGLSPITPLPEVKNIRVEPIKNINEPLPAWLADKPTRRNTVNTNIIIAAFFLAFFAVSGVF